jgi:YD repeat-containing protein
MLAFARSRRAIENTWANGGNTGDDMWSTWNNFWGEYNSDQKLVKQTDPEGNVVRYSYDNEGRMTKTIDGAAGVVMKETGKIVAQDVALAAANYIPLPPAVGFFTGRGLSGLAISRNYSGLEDVAKQYHTEQNIFMIMAQNSVQIQHIFT